MSRGKRGVRLGWRLPSAPLDRRPLAAGCLVATCTTAPFEYVTVVEGGLPMRFAVCSEHCYDIRWNALEPTTARDRMRSLVSLA